MDDKIIEAIKETSSKLNVSEFKTTKIVENIFNYLVNSMNKNEYANYKISYFGSFNIIEKRLAAKKERLNNKTNKTINNEKANESGTNGFSSETNEE